MRAFYVECPDLKSARLVDKTLAEYDQFQYDNNIKPDYSNAGGIEQFDPVDQVWEEVDEDELE